MQFRKGKLSGAYLRQCIKGVKACLPATAKYQQLCTYRNQHIKITHPICKYQHNLHCTCTLCTVPVHSALYQYTLYCTSTLCNVPIMYQYTQKYSSTVCTVEVYFQLYHYSLHCINTLCTVPVHNAL